MSVYRTAGQLGQAVAALAGAAPALCETFTLAQPSVEGAVISGLHIHAGDVKGSRNGVLLLGGVHARELMNPEAIVDLAADLLASYAQGSDITYAVPGSGTAGATWGASGIRVMLESLDIWMVPCSNPDGHDYVLSSDDMWRKNRRPEKGPTCSDGTQPVGVDLNRNCAIVWGVIPTNGEVSCDPCDYQVYCGPAAFSEPESENIEQLLSGYAIDTFADVHSYGEMILYPWGHAPEQTTDPAQNFTTLQTGTCNPLPDSSYSEYIDPVDLLKFQSIGTQIAADVAKVRGRDYDIGPSIGLYPTTGTNPEYAYSRHIADQGAHKTYGWTIETGPLSDNAADSFHPSDPSQIILDTKAAMLSLLMQSVCAIELIGTEPFGADAEAGEDQLASLRAWRDALWQTDAGKAWLGLYRQLHPMLLDRIAADEGFRSRVAELVEMAVTLAEDPDGALTDEHIRSGLEVIDDLVPTSPQHLRIQLRTAHALFQTMSGFSAQAALAAMAERSPG